MKKIKPYDFKIIFPRTEEHEFPKGREGVILCKKCNAVYYKKSWHHNQLRPKAIKIVLCPACQMIKDRQFEGEITISNIPEEISYDLEHLIKNFSQRAFEKDSQHRLINLKKNKIWIVTFTENQLAIKMAKKIKDAFEKVKITTHFSPAPSDVVYIKAEFL